LKEKQFLGVTIHRNTCINKFHLWANLTPVWKGKLMI